MALAYHPAVVERLRQWKASDAPLYMHAQRVLIAIRDDPSGHGTYAEAIDARLVTFTVPGRADMYVIVWFEQGDVTAIADIDSAAQFAQRQRFRLGHDL